MISSRSFGVELEVGNEIHNTVIGECIKLSSKKQVNVFSGWEQSDNNDRWHVKYDSTCGKPIPPDKAVDKKIKKSPGWEIASYVATGREDLIEISQVAHRLSKICLLNSNCGFHIHCNVADFNVEQLGVLMARWIKIEPMLCQLVPKNRVNNYYCRLLNKSKKIRKDVKYKAEDLWAIMKPTKYVAHENRQKKFTLNTVSIAGVLSGGAGYKRTTVEFRMPEGTLDARAIRAWVHFFVGFIDASYAAKMPTNLRAVRTLTNFFSYCGLSNNLVKDGDYDLLNAKLFMIERFNEFGTDKIKNQIKLGRI